MKTQLITLTMLVNEKDLPDIKGRLKVLLEEFEQDDYIFTAAISHKDAE